MVVDMQYPTDDVRLLTQALVGALDRVFRPGFKYSKAEVMLLNFCQPGESMQGIGIFDGDLAVVDRAIEPTHGHVVVTLYAQGALKLLSGGSASLAAVDDLHQATGRDWNLVAWRNYDATVAADMDESILGMQTSVWEVVQSLVVDKTWVGSEDVNILKILYGFLELVDIVSMQLAAHTHAPSLISGS